MSDEELAGLRRRVDSLEARMEAQENRTKPGRKAKPFLVSEEGKCALDPNRNSVSCPDASLYRRTQGCKGTACAVISSEYYKDRRNSVV